MIRIGRLEGFPDNDSLALAVGDRGSLLVVRRAGQLFIYENSCPHTRQRLDLDGGSLATSGGLLIQCQRHAAQFVPETGECVAGPCQGERLRAVAFSVCDGEVLLG